MKLFVCIYDDARLLPHFLRHYMRFGISEFHIASPPHLAGYVTNASRGYKVHLYDDFDVADSFIGGVAAVTNMRMLSQKPNETIVIVDLDEFVVFGEAVQDIAARMEAEGTNVVRGIMYDRFAANGQLVPFHEHSDLPSLYPVQARFVKEIMGGVDIKGVIVKGHLQSGGAHHIFHGEIISPELLQISHYKWNDQGLARVRSAYEKLSDGGIGWANQYKKILDHFDAHGRFAWETFGGKLVGVPADNVPHDQSTGEV
jgi:hypothetical protein